MTEDQYHSEIEMEELDTKRHCKPDNVAHILEIPVEGATVVGSAGHSFASKRGAAEGMMDIALLTANANQLRFLITYNTKTNTFYYSVALIVVSLILQIAVGFVLIFRRQMKTKGKRDKADKTNDFLVGGVFLVTVINVFAASFTTTDNPGQN